MDMQCTKLSKCLQHQLAGTNLHWLVNRDPRALVACPELVVRKSLVSGFEPAALRSPGQIHNKSYCSCQSLYKNHNATQLLLIPNQSLSTNPLGWTQLYKLSLLNNNPVRWPQAVFWTQLAQAKFVEHKTSDTTR